jgi:V8-like Glu-specific endopeptidase
MGLEILDRTQWPQVGMVLSYFPALDGRDPPYAVGTATLINPGAVLTAGHVVFDNSPDRGGLAIKFDILFNNRAEIRGIPGGNARLRTEWLATGPTNQPSQFDYSVILLGASVTGATPAGVVSTQPSGLLGRSASVVGFPAEGNLFGSFCGAADIARDTIGAPEDAFSIQYPIPTLGGMSGGPVYRTDETTNTIFIRAVHTNLLTNGDGNGLVILPGIADQISEWASRARF